MHSDMTALSDDQPSDQTTPSVVAQATPLPSRDRPPIGTDSRPWVPRSGCRYRGIRLRAKRLIDLAVAGPALILASPLLAGIAIGVRLGSPGPAIYRQVRVGRHGRHFTILKFRTMHVDADARLRDDPELHNRYLDGGFKLSIVEDPRVTRVGTVLRRTSLDELPQLVNVFRGEMSLVGPRPVLPEELGQYQDLLSAYLMATPGLTGAWQIAGRDAIRFPGRGRLDADYIDGWSLTGDLGIILRTLPAALTGRDIR